MLEAFVHCKSDDGHSVERDGGCVHVSAVIFAGGTGTRMGSEKPKQFMEVGGKPILIHTMEHFESSACVDDMVLVCKEDWIDYAQELLERYAIAKAKWAVPGGETGQLSIYAGLSKLREELETTSETVVLIHDGVRPLIDSATIEACVESVKQHGSAVTIAPAIETVVTLNKDNTLDRVVERGRCRMAKAPQCFWLEDILAAHDDAASKGKADYIDSAALMTAYGHKVACVDGPAENIKITTPIDYCTFDAIYRLKTEGVAHE